MFLIGVAGGSGSGKTTFAERIVKRVDSKSVQILHQDHYYASPMPQHLLLPGGDFNYDHPDAFDWKLMGDHLRVLKSGGRVEVPHYDHKSSRRVTKTQTLGPCSVLIFEGIYALWDSAIRDMMDVRVFLHVESDIRLIRRLHRDIQERARTVDAVIRQYYETVRPMHLQYIESTLSFADLVIPEENEVAADVIASRVLQVSEAE